LAQHPRRHFLDRAFGQFAELKRPERNADQAVDLEPERAEHVADLAVLALAHREAEPHVRALLTLEARLDRAVADAVDRDAGAERIERGLAHPAVRAHPVAAPPAGLRQFQPPP